MDRTRRLEKQFDAILRGKQPLISSNYTNFIDGIIAQTSAPTCANRIVSSKAGLTALQSAMRFDHLPTFLNGRAASLLKFFQDPELSTINGGAYLYRILEHIMEPPIFWTTLSQAFRDGKLDQAGQCGFAWLVFQRASMSVLGTVKLSCAAVDEDILESMKKSSYSEVRDFAGRISSIILPGTREQNSERAIFSAGGRHDNDFADYRKVEIPPTAGEIRCPDRAFFLPKSCIDDPSTEDNRVGIYLDNEFRLLREDMLYEMKEELAIAAGQKKGKHRGLIIDGLQFHGVNFGSESRRESWALELKCQTDLLYQAQGKGVAERKKFLVNNYSKPFRHQAWSCLMIDGEITAFPTLNRVEDLLARKPPVVVLFIDDRSIDRTLSRLKRAQHIRLIVLDTAVFSFEPILKALQGTLELPLHQELLHWKEADALNPPLDMPDPVVDRILRDPHQDLQTLLQTRKSIKLDDSQHKSLVAALTQRVSLIQGPPAIGTGKSFIGALLAKILHDHTDQKLLVVCYTNHALDQFLEDLLDIGIPSDSIVRLGGKSTPRTSRLSLKESSKASTFRLIGYDREAIVTLKSDAEADVQSLTEKFSEYMKKSVGLQDLLEYLEFEEPEVYFNFCVPRGQDGMTRVGRGGKPIEETYLIGRWTRGENPGIYHHLEWTPIWCRTLPQRQELWTQWISAMEDETLTEIASLASKYNNSLKQLAYIFSKKDNSVIAEKRIIGCTTTAAAKFNEQIREACPEVLLVEEAGEILESHIITAMNPRTDQLVLIGDHKQLRPKVNNYTLTVEKGEGYDLNMSLFERLVLKGYPHETLSQQHRMRPEISSLVRQLTYPDLVDAPQTLKRPIIRGLQDFVVFLNHAHPEEDIGQVAERREMNSTASKQNLFEVDMVLKTLKYLAQQGYGTDKVTILTPYLGQLQKLRKAFIDGKETDPVLNDLDSYDLIQAGLVTSATAQVGKRSVRLATIDNYQGEESDIIVASLTRSNPEHNIGFMFSPERLNVLLSRARNALIMIGNSDTFTKSRKGGDLWTLLLDMFKAQGHVYDGLPVKCERHPDRKALLKAPIDFENEVPDGGCKEPCGTRLSCGLHDCPSKCHQLADHSKMKCCVVMKHTCPQGHNQPYKCHQNPPLNCRKCEHEAKMAQKKQEEALAQQQKRDAEQLAHAKELAKMEEQIAQENQRAQDERDRRERKAALEQKKRDLESMRVRNDRIAKEASTRNVPQPSPTQAPSHSSTPSVVNAAAAQQSQTTASPTVTQPTPSTLHAPVVTPDSSKAPKGSASEADWNRQKQMEGAHNKEIDALMELTGLEDVKAQVLNIKAKIDLAKRQGIDLKGERLNVVMLGNPGTGKTTVARLYANFLSSVDALPGDHFIETTGSRVGDDGVAGMKKHIDDVLKAGGGAIFVDEAYQLVSGTSISGKEVLNFMLAEMENNAGKIVFILAGYRKEMEKFFEHNPGIPSRVPYQLRFDDYTDEELLLMLRKLIVKKYSGRMKVEGDIDGLYGRIAVRRLGRGRGKEGFGNARALQNMFSRVSERQAARINKERAAGLQPDDFLLLGQDLIGPKPDDALRDNASWAKLQNMIGLESVKNTIRVFIDLIQTNYRRELLEKEPVQVSFNRIFTGSPGTGKTTVAKLFGQILADLGLLSNGEQSELTLYSPVIVKNPADFLGAHLGQSEEKTKAILASTVGKVLVIDEAYMLDSGTSNDPYKTAVIDTIVAEVQSVPGEDRCVLLLGYKEQMMQMFQNVNPGLSRRFDIENPFHFEDFSDSELKEILEGKLKDQDLSATDPAKAVALDVLSRARNRPNFGNGGEVENVIKQAKIRQQKREASLPVSERSTDIIFLPEDFDPEHNRQENAGSNLQKLFEDVVGCEDIVRRLGDYQKVAAQMKARNMDARQHIPMNFIFKGPPGTGKTTTARKMGQVYYDMGLLSTTEVHECSVSDIVAQYVGQTGPLVKKTFEKALGRVLFIDEAYRLGDGHFAQEAVDEIVSLMTQERYASKLVIILAGYDDDMNQLMKVNTGLSSRFTEEVVFHHMAPEHCLDVLDKLLRKQEIIIEEVKDLTSPANAEMRNIIQALSGIPSWGNIRDIVTLSKQMIQRAFVTNEPGASPLTLTPEETVSCFRTMLNERQARNAPSAGTNNRRTKSSLPLPQQDPTPPTLNPISLNTKTQAAPPKTKTKAPSFQPKPKPAEMTDEDEDEGRDEGVSDDVWRQLKLDKAAQLAKQREAEKAARQLEEARKKEEEAKRLAKELAEAKAAAERQRIQDKREKARLQELKAKAEDARRRELAAKEERERLEALKRQQEERQRKEAIAQQRLQHMGVCVAGFRWIKQSGGYRCAGGGHFVSDGQLGL
ncbi:hypothetical protein V5O48_011177 [Marasmius crinis-equi]|uniref:AAA+ ATPase domain-containing protein n=1 Tax=Marasmius crinis-equi TaxID=585013 RepID=A0ABR3F699_9AGAR